MIAPGPMAGAERVVLGGLEALAAHGAAVRLVCLAESRVPGVVRDFLSAARARDLAVDVVEVRGRLDPGAVHRLRRALRAHPDAVLHTHGYKALVYAKLAAPRRRPHVCTQHGQTAHDSKVRLYETVASQLYRTIDRVVAVSPAGRDALVAEGVPAERVVVVRNFLDLALPAAPPRQLNGQPARVLALGRLAPEKALDRLIDAAAAAAAPLELVLTGDGPERVALENRARDRGVAARVYFPGFVHDVAHQLEAAHVFALPSLREGLPMALIEATCAGLPVVASRVGGVPELVRDGETGRLVAPGDVGALRSALDEVVRGYDRFAAAARRHAATLRAEYGVRRWADETLALYAAVRGDA